MGSKSGRRALRGGTAALVACVAALACRQAGEERPLPSPRFVELAPETTGLLFVNELPPDTSVNVFLYRNYYNGGGVALGDVDGDGLEDVYLSANRGPNKLFRNRGDLRFEDITDRAGVAGSPGWSTGVTMADVNGDGHLDIYVCNSGGTEGASRANELFVNRGDGTFFESAAEFGLDDAGLTTHAAFFDYDRDGDLDAYVLNNSFRPIATLQTRNLRRRRDRLGGDKLYRNDSGTFVDVSEEAGIYGSVIGFGLGAAVGDVTGDGWDDIYVSNDFYERDYLYVNNRDGTFSEQLTDRAYAISNFSMGADIADLTNDGLPEIFVTDMLPEDDRRLKQTTKFVDVNEHNRRVEEGFHHQYLRNTLQLNTGSGVFAEVGQLAGVHATDWSWGALLADFDNNGHRDVFVSNGVFKDVTDQDFIRYMSASPEVAAGRLGGEVDFASYVARMPSTPVANKMFANHGDLAFADSTARWGFGKPTFSNGAAYGDLDLDGDLDLVVNNLHAPAQVMRNLTVERGGARATRLTFVGPEGNTRALGASAVFFAGDQRVAYQHHTARGFQSSTTFHPLIALPDGAVRIDSAWLTSPSGETIVVGPDTLRSRFLIDFSGGSPSATRRGPTVPPPRAPSRRRTVEFLAERVVHTDDTYVDFDEDQLLYLTNAFDGPAFAIGRYGGREDGVMFFGGSASAPGRLLVWSEDSHRYRVVLPRAFVVDRGFEDGAACFVDYDGDGDDDLVVGSAGSEYFGSPHAYRLRLYEQRPGRSGRPEFVRERRRLLPEVKRPISSIVTGDFDEDGHPDLVIAGRFGVGGYGSPTQVVAYAGTGSGFRPRALPSRESGGQRGGMVSDLTLADVDGDGRDELIAVGEFMPVTVYHTTREPFDSIAVIPASEGLYRSIHAADLDGDGRAELICGNLGENNFLSSVGRERLHLYVGDVDGNGDREHVFAREAGGVEYPLALKHELEGVVPALKKRFVRYAEYAGEPLAEVFPEGALDTADHFEASNFASVVYRADRTPGGWRAERLPWQAQVSVVMAIASLDVDGDGDLDVLLGGNLGHNQPRVGRLDALRGLLLENEGGELRVRGGWSDLNLPGRIRHLVPFRAPRGDQLVAVVRNEGPLDLIDFPHDDREGAL